MKRNGRRRRASPRLAHRSLGALVCEIRCSQDHEKKKVCYGSITYVRACSTPVSGPHLRTSPSQPAE